jgi:uncharacterized metal-binding protein YceD (DUF177 family)
MSASAPEFSRPIAVARLGLEPFRQEIEATAEERAGLARRFDLVSLERLAAMVTLQRQSDGLIRLEAVFEAEFEQVCVVTLDPVPAKIAHDFVLLYGPADDEEAEIELDVDEPVFEPLTGEVIDIGEAVAQELSLALPEFPRLPDAEVEPTATSELEGPFADLTRLLRPPQN